MMLKHAFAALSLAAFAAGGAIAQQPIKRSAS